MAIRYGEKTIIKERREWETLSSMSFTFPSRGTRPAVAATTMKLVEVDRGARRAEQGRVISRDLNEQVASVRFPLLDEDGADTGQTMSVRELFEAAQSMFVALAADEDRKLATGGDNS